MRNLLAFAVLILTISLPCIANEHLWKLADKAINGPDESKEWEEFKAELEKAQKDKTVDYEWKPADKPHSPTLLRILQFYQPEIFGSIMAQRQEEKEKLAIEAAKPKEFADWDLSCAGKGMAGYVWRAKDPKSGAIVAIKTIKKSEARQELEILRKLKHPKLVELVNAIDHGEVIYVLTAFIPGGTLNQHVIERQGLVETECQGFMGQILEGLDYLHDAGICHKDLKLDNVMLLEDQKSVKLIDFGLSSFFTPGVAQKEERIGTQQYIAPEVFCDDPFNGAALDVWASGVVLFAMATGKFPFKDAQACVDIKFAWPQERKYSAELMTLVKRVFQFEWSARPTVKQICADPWFKAAGK